MDNNTTGGEIVCNHIASFAGLAESQWRIQRSVIWSRRKVLPRLVMGVEARSVAHYNKIFNGHEGGAEMQGMLC